MWSSLKVFHKAKRCFLDFRIYRSKALFPEQTECQVCYRYSPPKRWRGCIRLRTAGCKEVTSNSIDGGCCCSVTQSCLALCNSMNYSTPSFSILHYLPEFAQIHVHGVRDAIQPSHPLSPPSPTLSLSQHQGLFQWVGFSHQVAKVLELQLSISLSSEYAGLISFRSIGGTNGKEPECQCKKHKRCSFRSLGLEDPLEKEMATLASILGLENPWQEPGGPESTGSKWVRHDWSDLARGQQDVKKQLVIV